MIPTVITLTAIGLFAGSRNRVQDNKVSLDKPGLSSATHEGATLPLRGILPKTPVGGDPSHSLKENHPRV